MAETKDTTAVVEGEAVGKVKEYKPTEGQKARIQFVMEQWDDMITKRQQTYPQFNDRTLKEFIDDSEKRLNAYILDRSVQGKEDWQSNFATRAYANKTKALLAATARDIPDMKFDAVTKDQSYDYMASDIIKNLTRHSYQNGNPQLDLFFLGWSLVGHGTVISYEGIQQCQYKKKEIKSFDLITGDVEFTEKEVTSHGEPISFEVPLMNLLIKNFYISNIQDQPSLIWWSYYATKDQFDSEWGKYPNVQFVKNIADFKAEENNTYFYDHYREADESGTGYVVMRYMNKYQDVYRVIANGVELFNGPMLWEDVSKQGRKIYPFAKAIFEPFATGSFFFYGNSMPNSAMGEGDTLNTLVNSSLDKQYRSMVAPLIIGMVNKDMLDLEDEVVASDTKIYVDDVSQVKTMDVKGINSSDIEMINLISRGFDLTTLDPSQEGSAQKYVTARAAVASDERARQLKGVFFMMLEDLWLQKTRLRIPNVLLSYTKPQRKEVIGDEGEKTLQEIYRTINVQDAQLSNGQRGTLSIQFAQDRKSLQEMRPYIESEESKQQSQGKAYEKIGVVYDWLEKFSFDVQVIPASLWQTSQALGMSLVLEKTATLAKLFPEFFKANQDLLARDILKKYDDDPSKYQYPKSNPVPVGPDGKPIAGNSAGGGLISDITGSDSNNLGQLTGVQK